MFNPFIFEPKWNREKDSRHIDKERNAEYHGSLVRLPAGRSRMALRLGKLLIRMGKGLAGEPAVQAGPEQSTWPQGNPTNPQPARFHHA
jgi:hypothetical protein